MIGAMLAPLTAQAAEDWDAILEAAKAEGPVVVYTTLNPQNWEVILGGFNEVYPDIEVTPKRTGSNAETFERWRAEKASGTRTADVLMATGPDQWLAMGGQGDLISFEPSDAEMLPPFAIKPEGYFTLSIDPQPMIFNKLLLSEEQQPTGLKDLVAKIEQYPEVFEGKIGSYNPMVSPFSYSVYTGLMQHHGDEFWPLIDKLAPNLRFEQTAGVMTDKVQTGEYVAAFMLPRALLPSKLEGAQARVLGITFLDDGTVVLSRDMGVVEGGSSPNGGKLLVNYLMTEAGQKVVGEAGLTPYYPGIEADVQFHYNTIAPEGIDPEMGVAYFDYSPEVDAAMDDWRARFLEATEK
ncbi:ABC transporter substrate-binding protein [Pseudoruegeria sp. HB172150]|uniref:ABC transporter substrate-binding protein n=1 Tax=Pseudoruegeria sp. HB172150 TaxID=2721164 RepID=UPI001553BE87|nr:extracellular solute-binding protein [Pseudoruegeria sp. HB172150]